MNKNTKSYSNRELTPVSSKYQRILQINGSHSLRENMPFSYVDYATRSRKGGKVFFFNLELAKEMRLLSRSHPNRMTIDLERALLEAFNFEIINEYDLMKRKKVPTALRRFQRVLATRYLQLQHPDKRGFSSGDGRSVWCGEWFDGKHRWDISACGTGGTCLSPATAIHGKFFKTGDPAVSYGCGRSDLQSGVCEALMSEVFHENDLPTTRILCLISYPDGTSVNIRVHQNLLRPAHLFLHLRQNHYERLKKGVDYYIRNQVMNGSWPKIKDSKRCYEHFLLREAEAFGKVAAIFEMEYIFCWLDWDGDNILMDGSIIDYGSIRQFGLFHHEYRYDDVDKMSTTILEQKTKARNIVKTFAQLVDYLIHQKKKPLKNFQKSACLKHFEKTYQIQKKNILLYKIGFKKSQFSELLTDSVTCKILEDFQKEYMYFERQKSSKGTYEVSDGITWDAIFCIRDIMRELPRWLLNQKEMMTPDQFIEILRSDYANEKDLVITPSRKKHIVSFQKLYLKLVERSSVIFEKSQQKVFQELSVRSSVINRYERVTGDAIIHIANHLMEVAKQKTPERFYEIFREFVKKQNLNPDFEERKRKFSDPNAKKVIQKMQSIVREFREGI